MGCLTANDGHVSYRRLAAGDQIRGGGSRDFAAGLYLARGDHLREAEGLPRRVVVVFGLRVVGKDASDDVGGCRRSGELGVVARRHGRRCGAVLRAPGDTVSAVKRSVADIGDGGHDGDMTGWR